MIFFVTRTVHGIYVFAEGEKIILSLNIGLQQREISKHTNTHYKHTYIWHSLRYKEGMGGGRVCMLASKVDFQGTLCIISKEAEDTLNTS